MALAQIIDLDARRRARVAPQAQAPLAPSTMPVWYCMWMPVYFWYLA
jgi:hypothetical protein